MEVTTATQSEDEDGFKCVGGVEVVRFRIKLKTEPEGLADRSVVRGEGKSKR